MTVVVTAPRCWVLREPANSAPQETELLFGHKFRVDEIKSNWAYGQALSPLEQDVQGYKGWVKRKFLSEDAAPSTHTITSLKAPIFKKADIKSRVKRLLPMGAQINAARVGDVFCELPSGGFVHRQHLHPLGEFKLSDFVTIAEAHLGLPYIWGGVSSDGLDCSGLVQSALRAVGTDCLRDASQQEESLGVAIDLKARFKRGDLIFWPGHVGIMSDENTLLHANAFHMRVAKEAFSEATARMGAPRSIKRL